MPDIDLACAQLRTRGIDVGTPRQVGDIAYLAHFRDPEGFTIELIDHAFQGARAAGPRDTDRIGGGACLNLLTLRATELAPLKPAIRAMGMRPLAIMPAQAMGFDLYFYGFADEPPPDADLRAIANRTWLYRRPYTLLEIQHLADSAPITESRADAAGFAGAEIRGVAPDRLATRLGFGAAAPD